MAESLTFDDLLVDPDPVTIAVRRRNKRGETTDGTLRFFPRRPTQIELGLAAGAANGARRALRAKLLDESSEEHQLLLREALEGMDDEGLRSLWVQGNLMRRAAEVNFLSLEEREHIPEPEGDLVPAAEQDAHAAAVDQAEDNRVANLIASLNSIRDELTREAEAIEHGALISSATPAHIETLVQNEWDRVYTMQLIARCTFNDAKYQKPSFKTVARVEQLLAQKPGIYSQLASTHKALQLNMEPQLGK